MNASKLIPTDDLTGCPFPLFGSPVQQPKRVYKIYNDGGIMRDKRKELGADGKKKDKNAVDKIDLSTTFSGKHCSRSALDILFDSLYFTAFKQGLKDNKLDKPMTDFIRAGILKLYPDMDGLDEYIADRIKRKLNNLHHRKKRFRRKANLNNWNYFQTCTPAGVGNIWAYLKLRPIRGVYTSTGLFMYLRGKCSEQ